MGDEQHQVGEQYSTADIEKIPPNIDVNLNELINASGHVQELDRTFGFWSIVSLSLIAKNAWAAGSGALVIAGITLLAMIWLDTAIVLFGQKYIAKLSNASGIVCTIFLLVTLLTVVIMPSLPSGAGRAPSTFVWADWQNLTGWHSSGLVFLMGMLNGAYAVGTPDAVAHVSEDISNPGINVPKGIFSQLITGFSFTFVFYIALLHGITDLDAVFSSQLTTFPLAAIYAQATSSRPATAALLVIFFLDIFVTIPGAWITAGRMLWTLGCDDATPYPQLIGVISPRWRNSFNAQIVCTALGTVLVCIYIASSTAFNAFVGLFIIFTTMSYLAALLPHLLTRRQHVLPGRFYMRGVMGDVVISVACTYILVFNILYMFPSTYPVATPQEMNWASVMFVGISALLTVWCWWKIGRGYIGPRVELRGNDAVDVGRIGSDREVKETRREKV